MQKTIRAIAFLLVIVAACAAHAAEAIGDPRTLYTPGYFLDQVKFDGDAHRYYHDYAMEKAAGVTPSISPYIPDGDIILNWTNFNSRTYTVTDAGRYVEAWTFYTHGAQSYQKAFVTGHPKSYTVTWDFLAGLPNKPLAVDLIPLLKMINYTLEYHANGGSWSEPPDIMTYIWSNAVTVASASVISRTGYTFQDWNTKSNGTGIAVAAGVELANPSGGSQLKVTENNQEVTLYAQWKANKYPLTLVPGTGIEKICYAADGDGTPSLPGGTASIRWHETTVSTDVPVDYASTWYAYAVAKLGYTYADYSALKPNSGVMGLNGAYYEPVAAPNAIRVDYDGNGATSGSTPSSTFTYDKEGFLEKNGFSRTHTVTFNGNASGVSVDPSSAVATYTFTGWATSSVDAVSHRVSYTDGQAVTNLSTGADVRLYALWRAGSVDLPHATRPGHAFIGWYADKACRYKVGDAGGSFTPTKNVTLYAKWQASANVLRLQFGAGIARIYYRVGDTLAWTPVRSDTSVTLAYGTSWQAYAVAASGYTYTASAQDRPESGKIEGKDAVFRPEASAKTYDVTYDGNGKTSGSTSASRFTCGATEKLADNTFERSYRVNFYVKGSGASVDPTSQDVKYTFAGWNTEPDGSGAAYTNQATVSNLSLGAGVTLYAQWTASSVILPEPTWEGHAFLGWYADAAGTFKVADAGDAYTPTKNVTLYAQWDSLDYALVLYVGNGIEKICYATDGDGTPSLPGGTPSLPGGTASLRWIETSVSTNVVLDFGTKWYAYATAKPGYTHTATSETRPKTGTMTVEGAVFAPEATANTITVTYVGNGSTSGSTSSSRFTYDTPGVLTDNGFVRSYRVNFNANGEGAIVLPTSLDGAYTFTSWNTAADGSGESYTNQAMVLNLSTGDDVRLYAQWANATAAVILPEPVWKGHTFGGWYTEAACTNRVGGAGDVYIPTANTTLFALWDSRTYTVTFLDKTGTSVIRTEAVVYGGKATAPTAPAREAERFTDWSSEAYKSVSGDVEVRAQYETVKYHVNYNSNYQDGRTEREALSVGCGPDAEYSDRITLLDVGAKDLGYSKTGYKFLGWAWASDATKTNFAAGTTLAWNQMSDHSVASDTETQAANLYAVWEPITYTLRFEPGLADGEPVEQTLVYDRPDRLLANPYTLDHQCFLGWKLTGEATSSSLLKDQQEITNLTTTAGATITLTALWDGNGDHTVVFDGNGATNTSSYSQVFVGITAQHLRSNEFTRVGYEFMGWATNDIISTTVATTNETVVMEQTKRTIVITEGDTNRTIEVTVEIPKTNITVTTVTTSVTNWSPVVYQDRVSCHFSSDDPRYSTNTLYAVWEPIKYTIIFNTGVDGVTGTMQPLTFNGYDDEISIVNEYKKIFGESLEGWTCTQGCQEVEFPVKSRDYTVISNISALVDSKGNGVTLYAVWSGLGDLSTAAGLTNAVLRSESWKPGSEGGTNYVGVTKTTSGTYTMTSTIIGPGHFTFDWYWLVSDRNSEFSVNKRQICKGGSREWKTFEYPVSVTGQYTVAWTCTIPNTLSTNDLRVRNVCWTPRDQEQVAWTNYVLTYTNTKGAALPTSLPKTYAVTDETFEFERLPKVDGYEFAGWSPEKIVHNTTGDITVKAKWRKTSTTHQVTFDLDGGTQGSGGGGLEQTVDHEFDAVAPEVTPPGGKSFVGWDKPLTNIVSDLTVTALYDWVSYRIDYENTMGVVNMNRLGFTSNDLPVTVGALSDTRNAKFTGWTRVGRDGVPSPSAAGGGTPALPYVITDATNVTLQANWEACTWLTVTYELGDHLARTGGGALVQSVVSGSDAEKPSVQADEGYEFDWAAPVTNGTEVTIKAVVTTKTYDVTIGGETKSYSYGESVTAKAPKSGCIGYVGSGNVPGSGTANEVTFVVTGPGTLTWLYEEADATPVVTAAPRMLALVNSPTAESANTPTSTGFELVAASADAVAADESVCVVDGETNVFVSVTAGEGGSVRVLDPSGGVCDVNEFYAPTGVVLTAEAKAAPGWRFVGWEGDAVEDESATKVFTVEGPVALKAIFARTFTVTFELGEHLVQTGTVMLVQTVVANGFATAPGFIVDEGCTFNGWRADGGSDVCDKLPTVVRDVTFVAEVSVSQHALSLGTNSVTAAYGDVVTAVAPFDEVTTDGMCVTCVGWTGSGCVPASGGATQVVFTVTGAGTLTWLYETNCWVSVRASDSVRGAVAVLDPAGGVCPTNEFWAPVGAELTALAQVNAGYVFSGWWCEGALVSRLLSLALVVPASDLAYEARFEDPAKPKYDVTFKLGDHLSRTGGGEREQSVEEGQSAAIPEVEVEEKWCFAGWHVDQTSAPRTDIDKAGYLVDKEGLRVMKGEVPNIAGAMTLSGVATAKVYKVAFDVDVSVAEGCEWKGSVTGSKTSVKVGTKVTIKATAKTPYVFAGWYDGPFVELDAEPISQAASYSFTMPEKDVAYVAKFIAKSDDWAKVEVGEVADEYKRGVAIAPITVTATGGSLPTVKVSGLPTGLKFTAKDIVDAKTKVVTVPANTIYGTPTKSGVFTATVTATTVGKATATTSITFVVRAPGEHVVTAAVCDGAGAAAPARGKVTGTGVYAAGKKVTLKATAAKNYVFSGWYGAAGVDARPSEAASLVSRLSSLALVMPSHDLAYEARFITAAEDAKSVQAGVNGLALIVDGEPVAIAPKTNVTAGVYLVWPVVADADSAVTVAVSGLPSGLKFTAKPVTSKVTSTVDGRRVTTVVTNVPAMTIYGTPPAASKVDRYGTVTPSQVKVTVTTAGKNKVVSTLALTVDALPTALVGTYAGGATNEPIGSATVTLATTGKVSGKWISEGLTWTIAAANLSSYDCETKTATAVVTFKTGKLVETAELTFAINELGFGTVRAVLDDESGAAGVRARPLFSATSVPWKTDAELKSLALQLKNKTFVYNDPAQGATLTGKVGANGTVSVVGEFDVGAAKPYKATVSATLVPVDEDSTIFELFVYYPPVKNKFDGYAAKLLLMW